MFVGRVTKKWLLNTRDVGCDSTLRELLLTDCHYGVREEVGNTTAYLNVLGTASS